MKILLAASEVAPIIKMGGLGDVIGALPKALEKLNVECSVVVPFFPFAKVDANTLVKRLDIQVPYNGDTNLVEVYSTVLPESTVEVFLLQNDNYFHGHSKTWKISNEEELELFSFFDRAVVEFIKSEYNTYDLVHCHDWHTGLITHILSDELGLERPATLFTIHNLMYQGVGDPSIVRNVGIVPGEHMLIDWDVADGDVNMIQQGITSADFVSTVSPTYMTEIQTPDFGGGLEDVLKAREGRLAGILNGIDYSSMPKDFDEANYNSVKSTYKRSLQKKLDLKVDDGIPMFAFVGRLDPHQKGIDILYNVIPNIVKNGGQFVLLGTGDAEWEQKLKQLQTDVNNSQAISINTSFDLTLAHDIYCASDFLIAPSRYEPCGLIQMIAMWYGSLPIVRATGGLKDSVINGQNGFVFEDYTAESLNNAVLSAFTAYKGQAFGALVINALRADFRWDKSALAYKDLYTKIIHLHKENI